MRFEVGQIICPGKATYLDKTTGCDGASELEVVDVRPERNELHVRVITRKLFHLMSQDVYIVNLATYRDSTLARVTGSTFKVYDSFEVIRL